MRLENEIIVSGFKSNHDQVIVNLIFTFNWCNLQIKQSLKKYDITSQQYNILRILRGQHPRAATVTLLKQRMLDKMSDASRIVDRLMQKDLVLRKANPADKRVVNITITDKGLNLLNTIDAEVSFADIITANISPEEARTLNVLLDKLRG